MKEVVLHGRTFVPYLTGEQISAAVRELGLRLKNDFKGRDPLFVCIMNGSFMFASELMYTIDEEWEVAFARYKSYEGTQSTGRLQELLPVTQDLKGRVVVIVEDLIDTGYTVYCLKKLFLEQGALGVGSAKDVARTQGPVLEDDAVAGNAAFGARAGVHGKADEARLAWLADHGGNLSIGSDATFGNLAHHVVHPREEPLCHSGPPPGCPRP